MSLTPAQVEQRLRDALITLRRMPGGHIWPAGIRVAWPEIVREWEAYGWDRATRPRVQATAEDIRLMDEALGWTARWLNAEAAAREGLPQDTVKVVMWRAAGRRWDQIGVWRAELWGMRPQEGGGRSPIPGGNSYPSLVKIHRQGIELIVSKLAGTRDRDPLAEALQRFEDRREPELVEDVEVTYPVGEEGTYGPVHARARHVLVPRRRRG